MCEARGVAWGEVDLRWGVTDEQKADGAVLPICLAEIERTRPYFIGLLGQRYGWVPDELPGELADRLGWLADSAGRSVTELEIPHGVLNDPEAAGHAYFYLRDPAWVDGLPPEEQAVYREAPSAEEIESVGADDAEAAAATRRDQLDELKGRVRASGHPVADYADPVALGDQVRADLVALVERLYPDATPPDPLDRDAADHATHAASRFAGYVERPDLQSRLDGHAASDGPPLLVTGESGAGASALVANWARAWREANPDDLLVEHYVGATAEAADWSALVARVIGELVRGHDLVGIDPEAIPEEAAARRSMLASVLRRAGDSTRRTVLVIDAVDRLDDVDGAVDLIWLPTALPANVRVVLTSGAGRPLEAALHREWPTLDVPPLTESERRTLVATFLGRFSKALDEVHVARLATADLTGNPLDLRVVLDELRQHGDHFTLGPLIERLLGAATVDDLFELVLDRYEQDYERDRPGLVADAFRALWAARRGLNEHELLDVLGTADDPLAHAVWSPLFLAAEEGLVTRSGYLAFATDHLRRAVEDRYVSTPDRAADAHAVLADYFAGRPLGPRVVDELPWQQLGADRPDALAGTLADLEFMDLAYRTALADFRRLWVHAESAGHHMLDAYRPVLDSPDAGSDTAWAVARLLTDAGHGPEALGLHRLLVDHYRAAHDAEGGDKRLRAALANLGAALWLQGDYEGAEPPLTEAADLARKADDLPVLKAAVANLGLSRRDRGDYDGALEFFAEDERLCRETGDTFGLQATLGNLSELLQRQGDLDGAMARMTEMEQLCRDDGDRVGVQRAQAAQANLLAARGDREGALALFETYSETTREMGDTRGLIESLVNRATTLTELGRHDEATACADEAEELARRQGDQAMVARILGIRALPYMQAGPWPELERLARESLLAANQADAKAMITQALGQLGTAQREQGDASGARATHEEEERVALELGDPNSVAVARNNLASVDIAINQFDAALARYAQAEPVFRELGYLSNLYPLLSNRAQVHQHLGNLDAAVADYTAAAEVARDLGEPAAQQQWLNRVVELLYGAGRAAEAEATWTELADACRSLGDEPGLQRALGERALLVLGRMELDEAQVLLDEQEEICRRIGDDVGLASCVGNRAILLRHRGDLEGSLGCIDEQLTLSRATNNGQGVLFATANRGEVLGLLGRVDEGLVALEEAKAMASQWNLAPMVQQLDQMIADLRR
jgi:tetratricopeptide (TPR) repeat protein